MRGIIAVLCVTFPLIGLAACGGDGRREGAGAADSSCAVVRSGTRVCGADLNAYCQAFATASSDRLVCRQAGIRLPETQEEVTLRLQSERDAATARTRASAAPLEETIGAAISKETRVQRNAAGQTVLDEPARLSDSEQKAVCRVVPAGLNFSFADGTLC